MTRPDRVQLRGLRTSGRHGVLAAERLADQPFVIDLTLELDTAQAATSDELADTVDYAALARRVAAAVESEPVDLLETLAQRIAELCLADTRVEAVEVTVHKPAAPVEVAVDDICLTIHRSRP